MGYNYIGQFYPLGRNGHTSIYECTHFYQILFPFLIVIHLWGPPWDWEVELTCKHMDGSGAITEVRPKMEEMGSY